MATKVREEALVEEKSISAPSTPRRGDFRHSKRPTIDSLVRDPSMLHEKPIPNYLKPTISSCHHTTKGNSQPSEVSFTAGKSLPPRKPIDDKSPLPLPTGSQVPPKTSCGDRAKVSFENGSKKTLMRARSLPRVITKKRDTDADNFAKQSNCNEIQDHTLKKNAESSKQKLSEIKSPPKSKDNKISKQCAGNREETKNEHSETAKNTKTQRAKAAVANNCDGGKSKAMVEGDRKSEHERTAMLKRQDVRGKETQPMYNEVIEETAGKLAAKRSKVKALVGAFETVISLQEPEGQLGLPFDDAEIKAQRGEETEWTSKESRQQPVEMRNDDEKETERERAPKDDDQLDKHKLQEENTEGCETGQDSQQEESNVNLPGQLIEQEEEEVDAAEFDQENQQDTEIPQGGQNSPQEEAKDVNEEGKGGESYEVEREESA